MDYQLVATHVVDRIPIKIALEIVESLGLPAPHETDLAGDDLIVRLPQPDAWCSIYDFGAVAFFNAPTDQQERILAALRSRMTTLGAEDVTTDDFRVVLDVDATERVQFDHAVLNDLGRTKIGILALLLAQSATLERYERRVEDLLDNAEAVSEPMKHGRLPAYTRNTIRFIGISLSTRRDLISRLYILDEPESTWEDVSLDRLFKQMKATLDIDVRYRALEYKLGLIQEGVDVIVELTNAQRNIWLELIIVLLIIVEIVLALWRGH